MPSIPWQGPRPPAEVLTRLAAAGLSLAGESSAGWPRVLATRDARRIPDPGAGPWIWVCAAPLTLAAAAEAVRRGAYEAISLREPEAAVRLCARLGELLTEEAPPPPTPEVVAESPTSRRVLRQVWQAARTSMPVLITGETGTG
jgi:hypothetical protein